MISVIICTYNRATLLANVLQSLCDQSLDRAAYEIIVIDNNSTDATAMVSYDFATRYPNVRYYLEPQQGLSHARNRGWQEAKGDYVAYIDDDCEAPPEWLAVAQEIIKTITPVEFGGPHRPFYNAAKPRWWRDAYDSHHAGGYDRAAGYLEPMMELIGNNLFFQRAIFTQIGGFDPNLGVIGNTLRYGEETEIHFRLCRRDPSHRAYYEPRLLVYHLVRPEKLSLWWQLHSTFMHGRAYFPIHQSGQRLFTWWACLLLPLYVSLLSTGMLVQSWLWRDRNCYPDWRNYLYESETLAYYLHRLGIWSAYVQTIWPLLRRRGSNRHDA